MGERKVVNKYYPPDFDPSKIPKIKKPKNQQTNIRGMLPMSIRCKTCGNFIYKGTKFNKKKEEAVGEAYLGEIKVLRFYFKCTNCSSELTMKTDPKNHDYVMESGATRNYEPWRAEDEKADEEKRRRDSEETGDVMRSLENRTAESKREMDVIAALHEMKSVRARQARLSSDELLGALKRTHEEKEKERRALEEAQDEALIKQNFLRQKPPVIKRIDDDAMDDEEETTTEGNKRRKLPECNNAVSRNSKPLFKSSVKISVVKKQALEKGKKEGESAMKKPRLSVEESCETREKESNTTLQALGENYDSDEE